MKKALLALGFFVLFCGNFLFSDDEQGIVVEITGFKNDKGLARVTLFDKSDGFPANPKKALDSKSVKIKDGKCTVTFTNLSSGTYAIGVLHDENSNGKMDTAITGIPREGYGASKNPKSLMGPPKFKDCSFEYSEETITLKIKMKYGI